MEGNRQLDTSVSHCQWIKQLGKKEVGLNNTKPARPNGHVWKTLP